jgi:hypothetical protein
MRRLQVHVTLAGWLQVQRADVRERVRERGQPEPRRVGGQVAGHVAVHLEKNDRLALPEIAAVPQRPDVVGVGEARGREPAEGDTFLRSLRLQLAERGDAAQRRHLTVQRRGDTGRSHGRVEDGIPGQLEGIDAHAEGTAEYRWPRAQHHRRLARKPLGPQPVPGGPSQDRRRAAGLVQRHQHVGGRGPARAEIPGPRQQGVPGRGPSRCGRPLRRAGPGPGGARRGGASAGEGDGERERSHEQHCEEAGETGLPGHQRWHLSRPAI